MIHVTLDESNVPEWWRTAAERVTEELHKAKPSDRKRIIKRNTKLWQKAKPWLEELSYRKCWYCETRVDRSDNAVDHFRPKSAVKEDSSHEGYWWLAFDWKNYRFACSLCNSFRRSHRGATTGGKHDFFPIWKEESRARSCNDNLDLEQPMLLDPLVDGDPDHLWFEASGRPVPSPMYCDQASLPCKRVVETIKLLHLDEEAICERRKDLRREVLELVAAAQEAIALYAQGDRSGQALVRAAHKRLRRMAAPSQELSAVVRCALAELQGEFPFAKSVINWSA